MNATTIETRIVPPIPAATLILIRDGNGGIEVFMVQRPQQMDFATGAVVFPGGKVDKNDFDERLRMQCVGAEGLNDFELAIRVGCLREAFEECGVLFAIDVTTSQPVSAERMESLQSARAELATGELNLFEFLHREKLKLLPRQLIPFAHWITPVRMSKRFDTYFFVARAPEQEAKHDGYEAVDSLWITPVQMVARAQEEAKNLMFPTRLNLLKLAKSQSVDDALAAAYANTVVTVCPEVRKDELGQYLEIAVDAGYDETTQRLG